MDSEFENNIKQLAELLSVPKNVLLISHYNPDGDAIGSLMGMYHYLKQKGHNLSILVPNDFPAFLGWMKDSDKITVVCHDQKKAVASIKKADVIICVDFNDFTRLKDIGANISSSKAIKVLIDHHPNPDGNFSIKIVDTAASATAELIYKYIVAAGDKKYIDVTTAECIYAGIMTDTGCFSFNSSNPETFNIVAELLKCGINKDGIFHFVYDNFSYERMQLLGYCLSKKMIVMPELHTAYISLTKEDMLKYNFQPGDSEGFVNLPFSISGIFITALFTEKKDYVRISMRSRGNFSVNEFCQKYFEGGGHRNASGGESKLTLDETIKKFETLIHQYKHEIENFKWTN